MYKPIFSKTYHILEHCHARKSVCKHQIILFTEEIFSVTSDWIFYLHSCLNRLRLQ